MGQITTFPTNLPPAAITRIAGKMVTRYSPVEIGNAIELLMDLLDALGGDPDAEAGNDAEDDFTLSPNALALSNGPGCTVSDAPEQDDEDGQCNEDEVSYGDPGFGMRGPGCPIADPGEDNADREQVWHG